MSDYYTYGNTLIPNTTASANDVKAEFQKIETGLNKLPTVNELNRSTRNYIGIAGGSANVYTGTLSHVTGSYQDGQSVYFKVDAAKVNTGVSTLNISTLGAAAIVYSDGSALLAGELSGIHHVKYSTTLSKWVLISVSPVSAVAASASAAAAAADAVATAADAVATAADAAAAAASAAAAAASAATLLNTKVIDIGDWDMDTTTSVNIAHELDHTKIRAISVTIRNDSDNSTRIFPLVSTAGTTDEWAQASSTNIILYRATSGAFDNTNYNSTSYNRGWVTVQYIV